LKERVKQKRQTSRIVEITADIVKDVPAAEAAEFSKLPKASARHS
jgi:hypothetical protein